jgi:hypothetical protein
MRLYKIYMYAVWLYVRGTPLVHHVCIQGEQHYQAYPLLVLHDSSDLGPTRATGLDQFSCPIRRHGRTATLMCVRHLGPTCLVMSRIEILYKDATSRARGSHRPQQHTPSLLVTSLSGTLELSALTCS